MRATAAKILPVVPIALAITVFGTIYGALARSLLGTASTIVSSVLIFSGAVQFTVVGLLLAGAPPVALLLAALTLNLRNLVLGAVLRPRISTTPIRRAALSWFLVDEAVGLALQPGRDAARMLLVAGMVFYAAWIVGTLVGILGAGAVGLKGVAEAIFPVLFIGLAAISSRDPGIAVRAVVAAAITIVLVRLWPAGRGLAPVIAAAVVVIPPKVP
jgi:predicted branched-subunit amino acid permease